jgi:hypothetical protein
MNDSSEKPGYAGALACFASANSFLRGQAGEGACVPRGFHGFGASPCDMNDSSENQPRRIEEIEERTEKIFALFVSSWLIFIVSGVVHDDMCDSREKPWERTPFVYSQVFISFCAGGAADINRW